MSLAEYYRRYPRLVSEKSAYLEKQFLETVFYPEFGDVGLQYLEYQKRIYDEAYMRNYYIDFVIVVNDKKYAIELDGYNYHGKLTAKEFEKQEERTNEITRQGFELIRFSFNKVKKNPNAVRRELRYRIPLPKPQVPIGGNTPNLRAGDYIKMSNQYETTSPQVQRQKKGTHLDIIKVVILGILTIAIFSIIPFGYYMSARLQNKKAIDDRKAQDSSIQSFVDYYNKESEYSIENLTVINVNDESSLYYRKTNTHSYSNNTTRAMHGDMYGSEIWIISCGVDRPTNMRIYAESTNYNLLVGLVHISIPYLNPNSTDNKERLERFDTMIHDNQYGLYNGYINGTNTILNQNNDNGALVNKEKASSWRLNMNTGCADIWY